MHAFEHHPDTPVLTGNRDDWARSMHELYLDVVKDKKVLEIASNDAKISKEILKHSPKSFTMIDCDPESRTIQGAEFICEDVTFWLPTAGKYDVVVCFGLFYHLHHSLHLIELIVNHCQPDYLVLDCVVAPHPLAFIYEENNKPGNRWVNEKWKFAPFNLNVPFHIFNESLHHMDYELIKTHKLSCDFFSKSNHWVAQWRIR